MKRKLNLMNINNDAEVARKKMKNIKVGLTGSLCANYSACACGCKYANNSGSDTDTNFIANQECILYSPGVDFTNADNIDLIYD